MRPNDLDTDREWIKPETVVKAAINFMKAGSSFDIDHNGKVVKAVAVESAIARAPFKFGKEEVLEGDWFIGVHVPDKDTWNEVKKSGGFSIEGTGVRVKSEKGDKITLKLKIKGE